MKTIAELLREADPLGYEPPRSRQARGMSRRNVVLSRRRDVAHPSGRRRMLIAAAALVAGVSAVGGYWSRAVMDVVAAAVRFEARLAEEGPGDGLREIVVPGSGRRIYLHGDAVVTNSDIADAQVRPGDAASEFSVVITLTTEGAARMLRATSGHIGRPMALLIDGDVVMAPVVRAPITSSALVTGHFTRAEADRIVAGIVRK